MYAYLGDPSHSLIFGLWLGLFYFILFLKLYTQIITPKLKITKLKVKSENYIDLTFSLKFAITY
jgi:hypothetical protein